MQLKVSVNGFYNDFGNNNLFQPEKIQVYYTADQMGKTLSLASSKHNVQITIPFAELERLIRRTEK